MSPFEKRLTQAAMLATTLRGIVDRDIRMIGVALMLACLYAIVGLLDRIEYKQRVKNDSNNRDRR
jgi:hypothetical protein